MDNKRAGEGRRRGEEEGEEGEKKFSFVSLRLFPRVSQVWNGRIGSSSSNEIFINVNSFLLFLFHLNHVFFDFRMEI